MTLHQSSGPDGQPSDSLRPEGLRSERVGGAAEPTLTCPSCKTEIRLTEQLAAPLIEANRRRYEDMITAKEREIAERERHVGERLAQADRSAADFEAKLNERLADERLRIADEATKHARLLAAAAVAERDRQLAALQEVVGDREARLAKAQQVEADYIVKQRDLELRTREIELTIAQRVQESVDTVRAEARVAAETQLAAERDRIVAEERARAAMVTKAAVIDAAKDVAELQERMRAQDAKLAEAQIAQAEHLRAKREIDEQRRELELTLEKRLQAQLDDVRIKTKGEVEADLTLKLREKDEQMASMRVMLEDLKRKSDQGSQQLQGEVSELELEGRLRTKFPADLIDPVGKGEFGGDVVQTVVDGQGRHCGRILWESKRTKNWSDGWLAKLRDDQRAAKADVAVIVSNALPKGVATFDLVDEVWVADHRCALPVAICLRRALIETSAARYANDGQQGKVELVYQYLTGPRFKQRVGAIVEKFGDMRDDLDRERKMMTKNWAKREAQITVVIDATAGMYGDLQGIAGKEMLEIDAFGMPLIEGVAAPTE